MQVTQFQGVQRFTGSTNASWRPFSWMQNEGTVGMDLAMSNFFQLCHLNECPPQSATARLGRITDNQEKFRNLSAKLSSTSSWNAKNWLNLKTSIGGDYTNIGERLRPYRWHHAAPGAPTSLPRPRRARRTSSRLR
jgi:hypothetical protein